MVTKITKYLESLLGNSVECEELAELLDPLKKSIEAEKSTLESINQRISFLSEILALKKQVNLASSDRLRNLEESNWKLEKELSEIKSESSCLAAPDALDFEGFRYEIAQLEEQYNLLNECITRQLCLDCINKESE